MVLYILFILDGYQYQVSLEELCHLFITGSFIDHELEQSRILIMNRSREKKKKRKKLFPCVSRDWRNLHVRFFEYAEAEYLSDNDIYTFDPDLWYDDEDDFRYILCQKLDPKIAVTLVEFQPFEYLVNLSKAMFGEEDRDAAALIYNNNLKELEAMWLERQTKVDIRFGIEKSVEEVEKQQMEKEKEKKMEEVVNDKIKEEKVQELQEVKEEEKKNTIVIAGQEIEEINIKEEMAVIIEEKEAVRMIETVNKADEVIEWIQQVENIEDARAKLFSAELAQALFVAKHFDEYIFKMIVCVLRKEKIVYEIRKGPDKDLLFGWIRSRYNETILLKFELFVMGIDHKYKEDEVIDLVIARFKEVKWIIEM